MTGSARRRVMVVFGTRPEAIKLAPLVRVLERSPRLEPVICVTGQHREMLDQMLGFFGLRPAHDLALMRPEQDHLELGSRIVQRLGPVLERERPDAVIVQGDTTTTYNAALAATHLRIPCAHVEAGLRTFDANDPFPEELNRRRTTRLATWHLAPTPRARQNLLLEGIAPERIAVTGNTIVDALRHLVTALGDGDDKLPSAAREALRDGRRLLLVTVHRRENFGARLEGICGALRRLADRHADVTILFPVHPNPAVRDPVHRRLSDHPRIALTPPLDYPAFVALMRRAYLVLSDSGGVQEEAPSLGVPVLVLRDTTERPEGVEAGAAAIVGASEARIVSAAEKLLTDAAAHRRMTSVRNPYGDGNAAGAITSFLERALATR